MLHHRLRHRRIGQHTAVAQTEGDQQARPDHRLAQPLAHHLGFLEEVLVELARNDELEVAMLRVDGACAAYAVCLLDGSAVRQWHTSFDPAWSKLSPGTLITNATVERMLGDDRFTEYDFMRGVYDWKTELSNDLVPASCVLAWSSAPLRRAERALRSGRALLHSLPRR